MSQSSQVPDEFVAEVQKLQSTLVSKLNTLQQTQARLFERDRDRKRSDLTLHELSSIPESTRIFKAMGKSFVLKPSDRIKQELQDLSKKCLDETVTLKSLQQRLQNETTKIESELKELIQSRQ
ncbi:hypothetical protein P9112_004144 [Eukaryota sp. TZLM1-RC]